MPPRKRTDAADVETKAKLSHPSKPLIWLELSKAIGTMADPAPWSYEDFVSSLKLTKPIVPAYKPDAPPRECGVSIKEKGQIDAFVCEFNSASNPRGVFTSARSRQNHNYPGYRALSKWFDKTTAQIKLNLRFEEMYAANGVTVASHAQADMSGLMPQDECIWILQSIRKEWFGKHISPQTAEAQKIKAASLTFLKGLQSLTFNRWRGFLGRERRKIEEAEDEIRGYEALAQGGSIGPEDAVAYISALKKTLELVAVWKDGPLRERYEQLEMTTEVVLADLAGDVPPAFSALDLPKALRDALKNLPSPKMAERLRETLLEAMRTVQSTGEAITLGEHDHTDWKSGVEAYEHLRVPDIVSALGLPNEQLPFFLDKIDMVGSEDAWSEQGQRALKGPNASALKPFWHQWVGILKMIDNMFEGRSTLLLDGVGIGKTLQVIGFLAMYEWLYLQGDHCSARFKEMAKGHEKLPRVPHVLVVPCNRTPQWTDELHRYIKMGTIAILPYNHSCNLGARQAFWKAFDAIPEQIPIIILTTYTTLRSDAMTIYNLSCQWLLGGDDYSQVKPMGGVDPKLVSSTLLGSGRHFGIVAFDEIHTARKLGPVHFACSRLVDIAHAAVGLTGTPIITGPIDLVMIARILKIEGFSVEEVDGYRKGFNRLKAQENRSKVAKMKARQDAKAAALGKVPSQAASSGPSGETTSKQLAKNWLDEAREKAALHIVRRDRDSLDCDGKAISTLYPLTQTYIVVKLRKDEMAVQRQLANAIGKNNPFANDKNTSAFYNGLRQSLLHKSAADEQWARRNAQAFQYKDDPSTKIDVLVKILNFIKGKSCVPPIEYINGEIRVKSQVPPDWPRPEGSGPDKVVVFLAFPKSNWIVEKALDEEGISHLAVNSGSTTAKRAAILRDFRQGDTQVLLMSTIGTCGLNIAFANFLVLMDNPWSAQDTEQLIGRIWRHPQKKACQVLSIVAKKTSDIFVMDIAHDKGRMHAMFMNLPRPILRAFGLTQPDNPDAPDSDSDSNSDSDSDSDTDPETELFPPAKPTDEGEAAVATKKGSSVPKLGPGDNHGELSGEQSDKPSHAQSGEQSSAQRLEVPSMQPSAMAVDHPLVQWQELPKPWVVENLALDAMMVDFDGPVISNAQQGRSGMKREASQTSLSKWPSESEVQHRHAKKLRISAAPAEIPPSEDLVPDFDPNDHVDMSVPSPQDKGKNPDKSSQV